MSASQWKRLLRCPGSWALSKDCPRTETEYSKRGTRLHELVEKVLRGESIAHASVEEQEIVDKCYQQAMRFHSRLPLGQVAIEELLELNENIGGIVDLVLYKPGQKAIIIDWKFGTGVEVSAEYNEQLMIAAAGARKKWDIKEFELVIFQPSLSNDPSIWVPSEDDLQEFVYHVFQTEDEIVKGNTDLYPSEDACKFCPAKSKCPALAKVSHELAVKEFKPDTLSTEKIADILEKRAMIIDFLDAVKEHAEKAMLSGQPIPRHKLVEGRSYRKWIHDDETTAKDLYEVFGIEPWKKEIISPAQAEKLIPKDQREHLSGLITKPEGKPTLVHLTDKRPALTVHVDAHADFINNNTMEKLPWE